MTQPTPTNPAGLEPWQRALLPVARRSAVLAAAITVVANTCAMIAFRMITGLLPVDPTPTTAKLWGVNPTALTVAGMILIPAFSAAFLAFFLVWTDNVRLRSFNPLHWSGALNVLVAGASAVVAYSLGNRVWSDYTSLWAALATWAVFYGAVIPTVVDTHWRRSPR